MNTNMNTGIGINAAERQKVRLTISLAQLNHIMERLGSPANPDELELYHYLQGISIRLQSGKRQPAYAISEDTLAKARATNLLAEMRSGKVLSTDDKLIALKLAIDTGAATGEEFNEYYRLTLA